MAEYSPSVKTGINLDAFAQGRVAKSKADVVARLMSGADRNTTSTPPANDRRLTTHPQRTRRAYKSGQTDQHRAQ